MANRDVLQEYLRRSDPLMLEIGAGSSTKPGWLSTDLEPRDAPNGAKIIALDATLPFELPSGAFDFIYSEHMIEHISFDQGQSMLCECYRILKAGGVIRIVTPCLGFLTKVVSADRSNLEERYINWLVQSCKPNVPKVTNAFFLNIFMRSWGHTFVYDRETLELALSRAGFRQITACDLNMSRHPRLRGLENIKRLPPGFLELESMVLEATKVADIDDVANLALGKPATQSSVSQWSRGRTPEEDAGRAVSGHLSGAYNCHTDVEDRPWWQVDLGAMHNIEQILIYNRTDAVDIMSRTNCFEILLSNDNRDWTVVYRKNDAVLVGGKGDPFKVEFERPRAARFVRMQLLYRSVLHLDQVEIFGALAHAAVVEQGEAGGAASVSPGAAAAI